MILLSFILGILIIIGISRYNESDKLFWKLFISFIGAYTATVAVSKILSNKEQNKIETVQTVPTQGLPSASYIYCTLADVSSVATSDGLKSSGPVSQDSLFVKDDFILSKVSGAARDQPLSFYDTS